MDERVKKLRTSMKSGFGYDDPIESDQDKGVPAPQMMLFAKDENYIKLPSPEAVKTSGKGLLDLVRSRRSRRKFANKPLTQEQLAYLLFCTQGYENPRPGQNYAALRTVPSAGCRHPFDTYLAIRNVEGIEPGFYRYLPREHGLEPVRILAADELGKEVSRNCLKQTFCGKAPVCFFWVCDVYRSEWRYPGTAHKVVLLDAGHVCQNLYLACEDLGLGTCAIGAYDQKGCDEMLGLDGEDVFTLYVAPVGIPG